jgi:hypothetical protein
MVCMPLPRPPLHVDVIPGVWDMVAAVVGRVVTAGTAAMLILVALVYSWQIRRDRRKRP